MSNKEIKFCQYCGKELKKKIIGDEGEVPYCTTCNEFFFHNPICCVLIAIMNDQNQVLLIKQNELTKDYWVLVAGYIKSGEDLNQAVSREVFEETELKIDKSKFINSYYHEKKDLLMLCFIAHTKELSYSLTSSEVDDIKWVNINDALAFIKEGSIAYKHILQIKKMKENETVIK